MKRALQRHGGADKADRFENIPSFDGLRHGQWILLAWVALHDVSPSHD
jgi:hypothetical protein